MKIALLGDIALFGRFCMRNNPNIFQYLEPFRDFLRTQDVIVANLETPFSEVGRVFGAKSAHIKSDPCNIEILEYLGVTHVNLANNHIGDFGKEGLFLTKQILEKSGIAYFGVEGRQARIQSEGVRVALLGYCAFNTNPLFASGNDMNTVNALDVENVLAEMSLNAKAGVLSILSVHSGQEHVPMPSLSDVRFARGLAAKFNYVYYGHHPHVIQGVEMVKTSPIFYSIGNFLFDDVYTPRDKNKPLIKLTDDNKTGLIGSLEVQDNRVLKWGITPFFLGDHRISMNAEVKDFDMTPLNSLLLNIDESKYTRTRSEYIDKYLYSRRSLRDFKWYVKRLNFNSIKLLFAARKNHRLQTYHFEKKLELL